MPEAQVRVGVLTCGRVNHMPAVWGPLIDPDGARRFCGCTERQTDMTMTHVWDPEPAAAAEFAAAFPRVRIVEHYAGMVGKVDGVIVGDHDSCPHFYDLVRPYLQAGIPVFLNRPFALSLPDARRLLNLSATTGTPIMTGSTLEFAPEIEGIRQQIAGLGQIEGYAIANGTSDYSTHGIHGVLLAHACFGGTARSVAYGTRDWRLPGGVVTIEHEPGAGAAGMFGSVHQITDALGSIRVWGQGSFERSLDGSLPFWIPILRQMQQMFESRQAPQTDEQILQKTAMFLAGFQSAVDAGGAPVRLDELDDWRAPRLNANPYPAGYFED